MSKKPQISKAAVEQLIAKLEKPAAKFYMNWWLLEPGGDPEAGGGPEFVDQYEWKCGSAGCFAGWCFLLAPKEMVQEAIEEHGKFIMNVVPAVGKRFLVINDNFNGVASTLFNGGGYDLADIKKPQALAMLYHIRDKAVVDWRAVMGDCIPERRPDPPIEVELI